MVADAVTLLEAQAVLFANSAVHFPAKAQWPDDLMEELLTFPGVKHDDQVDTISQALACIAHTLRQIVLYWSLHMHGPNAPTLH